MDRVAHGPLHQEQARQQRDWASEAGRAEGSSRPSTDKPPYAGAPKSDHRMDLSALSRADKEYVQALIDLGYGKEAQDELRKRLPRS